MKKTLTNEQRNVVNHINGHALVKAVPGSGKTTALVKRVEKIVKLGVNHRSILVLMFNKAAQISFDKKLAIALGEYKCIPEVRTFHSLGLKVVKHAESNSILPKKKLITSDKVAYKKIVTASYKHGYDSDDTYIDNTKIEELETFISNCRSEVISPDDLDSDPSFDDISSSTKKAYRRYCELLEEQHLRTFDDVLIDAVAVLRMHPELGRHFSHIIVDEYQDVNYIQHEFIRLLAGNQASVMAVGDINQCIYEWRGSRPDFISGIFEKHFPNATVYHLSCTFRYGHQISMIANSVISKNANKMDKLCISHPQNKKSKIHLHHGRSLFDLIQDLKKDALSGTVETSAIIARSKADLMEAELTLRILNHPYRYISGESVLHSRHEIGLLIICFAIALHGDINQIAAKHSIKSYLYGFLYQGNFRWKSGQSSLIHQLLTKKTHDFWLTLKEHMLSGSNHQRSQYLALEEWKGRYSEDSKAYDLFNDFMNSGLFRGIQDGAVVRQESNDRARGVMRIGELLKQVDISSARFLEVLLQDSSPKGHLIPIELCTMHSSKGLEWDSVIIIGLNDSEYPGENPKGDGVAHILRGNQANEVKGELEEERRLFYVAITRAKSQLHLIVPYDTGLQHWLKNGWSSTPKGQAVVTRFVYEANVVHSAVVGQSLDRGEHPVLNKSMSKLYEWYLQELRKLTV